MALSLGCVSVVRLDSPDYKPTYDYANLIFKTDTLSKSRWYILTAYNLILKVYRPKDDELGKFQYFGTAVLTNEENEKNIFVPAEKDIYLLTEYSDYVVGVMSMCKVSVCFHPKQGETYKLTFNHESRSCNLVLSHGDSNEPIEAPCASPPKKSNGDEEK
jgi:hypothetical protein